MNEGIQMARKHAVAFNLINSQTMWGFFVDNIDKDLKHY